MANITLKQAAAWCGGSVDEQYENLEFAGACCNPEVLQPGQLFVALQGSQDGHDFIPAAMEKGAAALLCSRKVGEYPAICVDDPRIALGKIARGACRELGMQVVAVTGSVGKSTTKEMIASVLQQKYIVSKTPDNCSSDIGIPMAMLAMPRETEVAVLEMPMNHLREIASLLRTADPDVAVIVNIGSMHMDPPDSRQAKTEILEALSPEGKLLLNADDDMLNALPGESSRAVTYFGIGEGASVRAVDPVQRGESLTFRVEAGELRFPVELALVGDHFIPDALAAVGVGIQLGLTPEQIREGLASFRNAAGRQEIYKAGEYTIIRDCCSAGPESMEAALKVLSRHPGRRIAVLGDMPELGDRTQAEHYRIGRIAAEKADMVFAYGPNAKRILSGSITGGMPDAKAQAFTDRDICASALRRAARPGDTILFKGGCDMHMELILEAFLAE